MEFVDNSGHIFSLPSYNENPIGYEYDEQSYVFWLGYDNYERLSINNYYVKPIYMLFHIENEYENIDNVINSLDIDIYFNNTSIFKLLSPCQIQEKISNISTINDYIDFDIDNENIVKDSLSKEDIYFISTTETINNIDYNFLLIPIYVLGQASEEGTWMSNLMIYTKYDNQETWCPITIGGLFVDEYEELVINGKNLGINIPKDILKAIYQESLYNDEFNTELYNRKLKEYLLNYAGIRIELGNYNSVIKSLNWFGYGDKIVISKLMKTDNDVISQYVRDYFYTNDDILKSYRQFKNDSLISLTIMTNKESDETNGQNFEEYFFGEDKPKLIDLKNYNEIVEINNHDMPIKNDKEKYYYWKPYFDFSIVELGLKLSCLKYYYKKYFLPIHLNIHTASLSERVFTNDMKLSMNASSGYAVPFVQTYTEDKDIEFLGNGIHYFTKQIHYIDDYFNEYSQNYIEQNNDIVFYELNDTCINIPINFLNNKVYNCILLFERINKYQNDLLFESHFSFYNENSSYKNFIIYPKKLNINNLLESKYFEYWINSNFVIRLCVNGKWYDYEFESRISRPILDFGTLKYKYYFNSVNDILKESINEDDYSNYKHSLLILDKDDNTTDLSKEIEINNDYDYEDLYDLLNINDDLSVIVPNDSLNEEYNLAINYGNFNKFNQISNITTEKVNFNAYMHEHSLVETNNINFDIDLFKILKYNLQNNLQYIDGELLNDEFYSYIEYWDNLSKNDDRIITYLSNNANNVYGLEVYIKYDNGHYIKYHLKLYHNELSLYDTNLTYIKKWEDEKLYLRYEILIHKDLIGKNFKVDNLDLSNIRNTLIYSHNDEIFILQENDVNSNTYEVIVNNEGLLMGENEYNEENIYDPFLLLLESLDFTYDEVNNRYILNTGDEEIYFNIYDKLFQNTDYIYDKYSYDVNLINNDKYLNSIHLFNIYNRNYRLSNSLSLNKNTDINVNGINFKFVDKSMDIIDNDYINIKNLLNNKVYSNEIKISGHIDNDIIDADSRYPDVYGLYWDHYFNDTENGSITFNDINIDAKYINNEEQQKKYSIIEEDGNKYIIETIDEENEGETITQELNRYLTFTNFDLNKEINLANVLAEKESYTFIVKLGNYYIETTNVDERGNEYKRLISINHTVENINKNLELHKFAIDMNNSYPKNYSIYYDKTNKQYFQYYITEINGIIDLYKNVIDVNEGFKKKLNIEKVNDTPSNFQSWSNYGLYVKRQYDNSNGIEGLIELDGDNNYVTNEYEYNVEDTQTLLGKFKYKTLEDFYNGECLEYPENFNGNLIIEKDEETNKFNYYWEDPLLYNFNEDIKYKHPLKFKIQYAIYNSETHNDDVFDFTAEQLYSNDYDYLIISFLYNKVHCIKNKYYSLPDFILSNHVNGVKSKNGYYINGDENKRISYLIIDNEDYINWTDENNIIHKAPIMKVSNMCRYINRWGDEIKLQNPSGYWLSLDNVKENLNINKYVNELKRYWFNENENSTKGDTLEEIRNSLQTYKDKLEASSDPNNPDSTYGLNLEDRLELRYRYKNYVSKYYTGVKGRFKIDWEYLTELDEKDKIFNLCVCITRKDNTIEIYNTNKDEFELYGDEIEVVAYFRLNTKGKENGTEITPFIIKPRILTLSEENSKFEYDYTKYGNEVSVMIGNNEYKYGDNSSSETINLYSQFFENKLKLYDLYVKDNVLKKKLLYSIYDCKDQINISNNNSYDFYLMHDDKYWYGVYISKNTCDNMKLEDILIDKSKKELKLNNDYTLKYERSGKEFLINRMKYISKEGINHFRNDDIIAAKICNNDRLPTKLNVSSKWSISPMSLGMNVSNSFESNAEMTILSLPDNDTKHQTGYYKVTVRYSLDRDLQHQFKDSGTIRVS